MASILKFDLMNGTVDSTFPCRKHDVINAPGGSLMFKVEFDDIYQIYLIAEARNRIGPDKSAKSVFIFDKQLRFMYTNSLNMQLVKRGFCSKCRVFSVKVETDGLISRVGKLKITESGVVTFNGAIVENKLSKARYAKAAMVMKNASI